MVLETSGTHELGCILGDVRIINQSQGKNKPVLIFRLVSPTSIPSKKNCVFIYSCLVVLVHPYLKGYFYCSILCLFYNSSVKWAEEMEAQRNEIICLKITHLVSSRVNVQLRWFGFTVHELLLFTMLSSHYKEMSSSQLLSFFFFTDTTTRS